MRIEFLRAHKAEGQSYTKGQVVDLSELKAQELIRQGVAKQSAGPGESDPGKR